MSEESPRAWAFHAFWMGQWPLWLAAQHGPGWHPVLCGCQDTGAQLGAHCGVSSEPLGVTCCPGERGDAPPLGLSASSLTWRSPAGWPQRLGEDQRLFQGFPHKVPSQPQGFYLPSFPRGSQWAGKIFDAPSL